MAGKQFDWKGFAEKHKARLQLDDSFWDFWRYFFCEKTLEKRSEWKRLDKNFDNHVEQVRRLVDLARKTE